MKVLYWPSRWVVYVSQPDWRGYVYGRQHQMPRGPALVYGTTWELI